MSQDVTPGFPFSLGPTGTEDSEAHLTGWGPKGISPSSRCLMRTPVLGVTG